MRKLLRGSIVLVAVGSVLTGTHVARVAAQPPQSFPTEITQIRFKSGQSVVPYFEGWIRNADGTVDMVFGYFNRNWEEEFAVPAGPDNRVEPGGPDRGQPTYFLPRRQRFVYRVRVPADFGSKNEVVWTITANGRTEKGYGNLLPAQEITNRVVMTNGNFNPGHHDPNQAPAIIVAPVSNVTAGTTVRLTASVTDDGLPKPRVEAPRPATPPAPGAFGAQVNTSGGRRPRGLTVSWLQYSGPAKVTFSPDEAIRVANGEAIATARFAAPGTYKLIATANDGSLSTKVEVTVQVAAAPSTQGPR